MGEVASRVADMSTSPSKNAWASELCSEILRKPLRLFWKSLVLIRITPDYSGTFPDVPSFEPEIPDFSPEFPCFNPDFPYFKKEFPDFIPGFLIFIRIFPILYWIFQISIQIYENFPDLIG